MNRTIKFFALFLSRYFYIRIVFVYPVRITRKLWKIGDRTKNVFRHTPFVFLHGAFVKKIFYFLSQMSALEIKAIL